MPLLQEVDIKKQQSSAPYAFLQFCDIESVVKAMRAMDGEHLGGSAVSIILMSVFFDSFSYHVSVPDNCPISLSVLKMPLKFSGISKSTQGIINIAPFIGRKKRGHKWKRHSNSVLWDVR